MLSRLDSDHSLQLGNKMNIYNIMTPLELKRAEKFRKKHKHFQGEVHYIVVPGPIGEGLYIQCMGCLQVKDITDYGCW